MKAYHQTELEHFVDWAREELVGAQLQNVLSYDQALVMEFYRKAQGAIFLLIDLQLNSPLALLFPQNPFGAGKVQRPVGLFLNSHAKNLYVQDLSFESALGRVFRMKLATTGRDCRIEFQLIPKAANVLVEAGKKKIAWEKPKPLAEVQTPEAEEVRSIAAIHREWMGRRKNPATVTSSPETLVRKKIAKDLEKKKKALVEINKVLEGDADQDWYRLGELLKTEPLAQVGREWDLYLDRRRNQAWNMEQVFHKAKSFGKKREGTLERKKILEAEILRLEGDTESEVRARLAREAEPRRHGPTEVKTRKRELPSGVIAYLGKSAADNMKILRQARAWDLWLHLRDYPSAHAIIQRNKNQNVGLPDLQAVALWLAQETLQKKVLLSGTRLEIIYAECRFVRPIKADKVGHVQYQNEKNFILVVP